MIHMLAEAEPRPPHPILDDGPRLAIRKLDALTAIVLGVWRQSDGRHGARLNAYVDGLGHRVVQAELTPAGYAQATFALDHPGILVRCSGELVDDGPYANLRATEDLRLLVPDDPRG